jgi:hypothetical protein
MVFQKRRSATLEKAQARLRGLQSIHPDLHLGNGLNLQDYADLIDTSSARLQAHNLALSEADRTRIEFAEAEATVAAFSSRILSAVAAMYGRNSKEYEMAGGKPLGGYRRSQKSLVAADLNESQPRTSASDNRLTPETSRNGTGAVI